MDVMLNGRARRPPRARARTAHAAAALAVTPISVAAQLAHPHEIENTRATRLAGQASARQNVLIATLAQRATT